MRGRVLENHVARNNLPPVPCNHVNDKMSPPKPLHSNFTLSYSNMPGSARYMLLYLALK